MLASLVATWVNVEPWNRFNVEPTGSDGLPMSDETCGFVLSATVIKRGLPPKQGRLQQMNTGMPFERVGIDITGPPPEIKEWFHLHSYNDGLFFQMGRSVSD